MSAEIADEAVADLRALLERVRRDLLRSLVSLGTEKGASDLVKAQAQTSAQVYRQIAARLQEATGEVQSAASKRAVEAVEAATGKPPKALAVDARRELKAIVDGANKEVATSIKDATAEIRKAINAGVNSGGPLDDLIADVGERLDASFSRASAAVDAAVMGAGRRATMADAAASGVPWVFLYVGPTDAKNRPFCRRWVGRCATAPDKIPPEDEQPGPVGTYCGGYRCRHTWAPITRARAEARGYVIVDTG